MRGKNLIKLLKALECLSRPEGATVEEMAAQLEVDKRSVYRTFNVIEELGFPLYDEKTPYEKEKRWKLEESYLKKLPNMKVPDINLSLPEVISLYLLRSGAGPLRGTDMERHVNTAFGKLSMFLPKDALNNLTKIKALFVPASCSGKDYSGKEEIIDQLTTSILKNESCYVRYHSFHDDKIKSFKIDPLHFFENDGGLYLFVNTTTFGDIRTLAVERIEEIKATGSYFKYPQGFDPQELLESAFDIVYEEPIRVKILFSADQARYIKERKWSKTQEIIDREDGSIILTMETSGWYDIKKWVLSYGKDATLLEPGEMREEIKSELESAHSNYKEGNT